MSENRDSVVKSIIALLSSTKATRLADINRDYLNVVGERIPFKKFGFNSMEDFFHSIPEFVITKKQNDYYVETRGASKSSHINELVSGQKSNASRSKSKGSKFRAHKIRYGKPDASHRPSATHRPSAPPSRPVPLLVKKLPEQSSNYNHQIPKDKKLTPTFDHNKNINHAPPLQLKALEQLSIKPKQSTEKKPVAAASSYMPPPLNNAMPIRPLLSLPIIPSPTASTVDKTSQPKLKSKATAVVSVSANEMEEVDHSAPLHRLMDLLKKRQCPPPKFDLLIQKNWSQEKLKPFLCIVTIHWINDLGENKLEVESCLRFTTYPKEFFNRIDGMNAVSEIALEDLMSRISLLPHTTSFPSLVLSRISEIVADNPHGVWLHSLKGLYEKTYSESLPSNWFDLISESNLFSVENLLQNYWVIKSTKNEALLTPPSIPPLTTISVPALVLPESNTWEVSIVHVNLFNSVVLRILTDEYMEFAEMANEMDDLYNASPSDHIPRHVTVGNYYACRDDYGDDTQWSRVRVTHVDEASALVYLIDHGETISVDVDALRELPQQFARLPAQALECLLDGLEGCDFTDFEKHADACLRIVQLIVGLTCVAVVKDREARRVVLHDTSGDSDLNLNEVIKANLLNELRAPTINQDGLFDVFVVNVENSGVFLQIPSFAHSFLGEKLRQVDDKEFRLEPVNNFKEVTVSDVYFIQQDKFFRVKIIDVDFDRKAVDVEIMDLGGARTVKVNQLLRAPQLQSVIKHIPAQATQVALKGVRPSKTSNIAAFFQEKAPCPAPALARVLSTEEGPLPVVSLFIRRGRDNCLVNVNMSLNSYEPNKLNPIGEVDEKIDFDDDSLDKVTNKDVLDQRKLLPQCGEIFKVYVRDFVNPHTFTVIPADYLNTLNEMVLSMTEYYKSTPPHGLDLPTDNLCAVFDPLHNFWFRAKVMKYVDNQCCSRLLDYGNILVASPWHVRPLVDRFKVHPPLAFLAKVHGILPLANAWDAEDCIEFSERVSDKKFLAVIKSIETNEVTGIVHLSLAIFDTTNDEDTEWADDLVRSGIARFSE